MKIKLIEVKNKIIKNEDCSQYISVLPCSVKTADGYLIGGISDFTGTYGCIYPSREGFDINDCDCLKQLNFINLSDLRLLEDIPVLDVGTEVRIGDNLATVQWEDSDDCTDNLIDLNYYVKFKSNSDNSISGTKSNSVLNQSDEPWYDGVFLWTDIQLA